MFVAGRPSVVWHCRLQWRWAGQWHNGEYTCIRQLTVDVSRVTVSPAWLLNGLLWFKHSIGTRIFTWKEFELLQYFCCFHWWIFQLVYIPPCGCLTFALINNLKCWFLKPWKSHLIWQGSHGHKKSCKVMENKNWFSRPGKVMEKRQMEKSHGIWDFPETRICVHLYMGWPSRGGAVLYSLSPQLGEDPPCWGPGVILRGNRGGSVGSVFNSGPMCCRF